MSYLTVNINGEFIHQFNSSLDLTNW